MTQSLQVWMWTTCDDFKPDYLFNENIEKLVHLVDDTFWYMTFRNTQHTEKVLNYI
jgi:hypothetical protein